MFFLELGPSGVLIQDIRVICTEFFAVECLPSIDTLGQISRDSNEKGLPAMLDHIHVPKKLVTAVEIIQYGGYAIIWNPRIASDWLITYKKFTQNSKPNTVTSNWAFCIHLYR